MSGEKFKFMTLNFKGDIVTQSHYMKKLHKKGCFLGAYESVGGRHWVENFSSYR